MRSLLHQDPRPPYWPCTTYTTSAATMLNLPSRADVATTLVNMITALSPITHLEADLMTHRPNV